MEHTEGKQASVTLPKLTAEGRVVQFFGIPPFDCTTLPLCKERREL